MALTVESVDEIISFCRESLVLLLFKSKPLRRTFLWCCFFFMLCEVVLTFDSVDEILSCGQLLLCSAQFISIPQQQPSNWGWVVQVVQL